MGHLDAAQTTARAPANKKEECVTPGSVTSSFVELVNPYKKLTSFQVIPILSSIILFL